MLNICRALRFRMLLDRKQLPLGGLFPITLCHNFFVRTLPLMVGELSYIALLRRHLKIPVSEGVRSLFEARLFDLQFVIVGGTFGLLTLGREPTGYVLAVLALAGGLIIANRVLFTVLPKGIGRIWTCIVRIYPWRHTALLDSAGHKLGEVSLQLDRFRCLRPLLKALTVSLCTYGINVSCHLLLLSTLNVNQRLSVLLVVISIVMIAAWFPFSLSGFGVIEGSWAASLVMFTDMEVGAALSVGFFIHCCQVLMTSLLGLLGFVLLTSRVRERLMPARKQTQKRVPTS
ncbi:flippase-like domain-containing protein [Candidatus Poribacteria bacterium]|nr:flippase-like domain-containing protein [Candidatus Poribacteria bacterium]